MVNNGSVAELDILITREQIARRVAELGAAITRDFAGQSLLMVGVLKGATVFLSDLARQVALDATFDFVGISSYGDGTKSSGEVRLTKDVDTSAAGRNVLLVEDILDTGLTMDYLQRVLSAHGPRALRTCALLDKPSRRVLPVQADYVGFEIPDRFVVGYGMDLGERYRNLADIRILS